MEPNQGLHKEALPPRFKLILSLLYSVFSRTIGSPPQLDAIQNKRDIADFNVAFVLGNGNRILFLSWQLSVLISLVIQK